MRTPRSAQGSEPVAARAEIRQRGLVDEILVYVLPVLLGDGIRFSSSGLARTDLEPLSSTQSGEATILRFRVIKPSGQTAR